MVCAEYKIKNGAIFHKCYACGAKEMVDMSHKLCTYIVNTAKKAKKGKDKDKDSKEKKREKKVGLQQSTLPLALRRCVCVFFKVAVEFVICLSCWCRAPLFFPQEGVGSCAPFADRWIVCLCPCP